MALVCADGTLGKPVGGVEALFEPLALGAATSNFLTRHVYGTDGHRYRHATAEDGWRRRSLMLVVTTVIMLQRMFGIAEPSEPQPVYRDDISNLLLRAFDEA